MRSLLGLAVTALSLAGLTSAQADGAAGPAQEERLAANCVLHQALPKPTAPGSSPVVQEAAKKLTAAFEAALLEESVITVNNSWSAQVWSLHEEEPLWEHYHAAFNLEEVNQNGTTDIDGETVYRLGSLTKIFTVLTWLAVDGDKNWFAPITDFLPELRDIQARTNPERDPVRYVNWDEVTIGALAGQMAGIPRDYGLLGEMSQDYGSTLEPFGFPALKDLPEKPPCGVYPLCNRTQLYEGLVDLMPVFSPDDRAAYSNIAYILLAWALEEKTGQDWETIVNENVLEPLGLEHTYHTTPDDFSVGAIPGNAREVGWMNQLGDEGPAGSMFSSANDLTRFGKAILGSKLLPQAMTNRWIRPVTFTSDPMAALGSPWGIRRINMGQMYDWIFGYQKAGRIGEYSALMIMIPNLDIGFTLMTAGPMPVNMNFDFADSMGAFLLPAIYEAARQETRALYQGNYLATDGGDDDLGTALNSSMVLSVDDQPGIRVDSWVSNGTDMRSLAIMLTFGTTTVGDPRVRLFPTGLETKRADGTRAKASFKGTFEDAASAARTGRLFSTDCATWLSATSTVWAARSLDQFVFHYSDDGQDVVAVEPVALRVMLGKTDTEPPMAAAPDDDAEGKEEELEEVLDDDDQAVDGEGEAAPEVDFEGLDDLGSEGPEEVDTEVEDAEVGAVDDEP